MWFGGFRRVPRSQKDPGSWIPRIQDLGSWSILDPIFLFSRGILEILDPAKAILPWGARDLVSRKKDSAGSWGSRIQFDKVVVIFCRSWILHNNNVTVFWTSFTFNEILLLIPQIYALLKLEHCYEFQPHIESAILCWPENKLTLLVPPHVLYYRRVVDPRLTEGLFFAPSRFFCDISRRYVRIIAKFSITSRPSIWHILTEGKFDSFDRSAINDVRVTSYFPVFRQK